MPFIRQQEENLPYFLKSRAKRGLPIATKHIRSAFSYPSILTNFKRRRGHLLLPLEYCSYSAPSLRSGFQKKSPSARPKPSRLAARLIQVLHHFHLAGEHGIRNEVGNLVAGADRRRQVAQIFHQDFDLAAIA